MRIISTAILAASLAVFSGGGSAIAQQNAQSSIGQRATSSQNLVSREVLHQLTMLPRYTIYDNLEYSVNGGHITLKGEVVNPVLKSDAEGAVKSVEGVESVDNQIQVLPLSPMDNDIRHAEYRAIYSQPNLQRYAEGALATIHIIVNNGHVTLEGAVANQADKDAAGIKGNTVPNVFSVTNDLKIDPKVG